MRVAGRWTVGLVRCWIVIRIELSTVVARRVHEVFQYLADFENLLDYEPAVEEVRRTSSGSVGVGSTWTHVGRMGRRRIEAPLGGLGGLDGGAVMIESSAPVGSSPGSVGSSQAARCARRARSSKAVW